jgi:histidinol phosphatase-like PHP family hydrolase
MKRLFDCHAHTSDLSYCCDADIVPDTYVQVLRSCRDFRGFAITNHGFATYFPEKVAWTAAYMRNPRLFDEQRQFGNERLARHLEIVEPLREFGIFTGMEVEMMVDGRLTVDDQFTPRLDVLIGSVHFLPDLENKEMSRQEVLEGWWRHTEALAGRGIDILGHPFRWLSRTGNVPITPELIQRLIAMAARFKIAIEINAHSVIPGDLELLRGCVAAGVQVAFGSDSHARAEIGNLDYQKGLVAQAGLSLDDIPLWYPAALR